MIKQAAIFLLILFLTACSISPLPTENNQAAHYNMELGLNYLQQGDMARAKYKLLLAQQQAPNDSMVQDAMGYFFERTGEIKQAQKYYIEAIHLAPKSGIVQNNYGTFLCRQGAYQEAVNHFIIATHDANYLHPAQAYENAGLCSLKIPNTVAAENFFTKALAHDPLRPSLLWELAKLNYDQHHYPEAKSFLNRYLKIAKVNHENQALANKIAQT